MSPPTIKRGKDEANIVIMRTSLLLNAKCAICQLYHG